MFTINATNATIIHQTIPSLGLNNKCDIDITLRCLCLRLDDSNKGWVCFSRNDSKNNEEMNARHRRYVEYAPRSFSRNLPPVITGVAQMKKNM